MTHDTIRFRLIEIINDLEREIVKPVEVDAGGIVTNHMAAVWAARDAINQACEECEEEPAP